MSGPSGNVTPFLKLLSLAVAEQADHEGLLVLEAGNLAGEALDFGSETGYLRRVQIAPLGSLFGNAIRVRFGDRPQHEDRHEDNQEGRHDHTLRERDGAGFSVWL